MGAWLGQVAKSPHRVRTASCAPQEREVSWSVKGQQDFHECSDPAYHRVCIATSVSMFCAYSTKVQTQCCAFLLLIYSCRTTAVTATPSPPCVVIACAKEASHPWGNIAQVMVPSPPPLLCRGDYYARGGGGGSWSAGTHSAKGRAVSTTSQAQHTYVRLDRQGSANATTQSKPHENRARIERQKNDKASGFRTTKRQDHSREAPIPKHICGTPPASSRSIWLPPLVMPGFNPAYPKGPG